MEAGTIPYHASSTKEVLEVFVFVVEFTTLLANICIIIGFVRVFHCNVTCVDRANLEV